MTDHDRRSLKRTVAQKRKTTLAQIISEISSHLQNPVFTGAIQREFHDTSIHGRESIWKALVSSRGMKLRQCYRGYLNWAKQQWEQVIWSDESTFTLFKTTERVFLRVWEAFHVDCLVPTERHGRKYVFECRAIPRKKSRGKHDFSIVADYLHRMFQSLLFIGELPHVLRWQHPYTHSSVCSNIVNEHADEVVTSISLSHRHWGFVEFLENNVPARFTTPWTLHKPEAALREK